MNNILKIVIIILFVIFLINKFNLFQTNEKQNNRVTRKGKRQQNKDGNTDSFWNTENELSSLTEEKCQQLLDPPNPDNAKPISEKTERCCLYISAIKNSKNLKQEHIDKLAQLEDQKKTVQENIKNSLKCSNEEQKLMKCVNDKINTNNKAEDQEQVQEVKAADFYKDYANLVKTENDTVLNQSKIDTIKNLTEECLTRNTYFTNEDENNEDNKNKDKCSNLFFNRPLLDENLINTKINDHNKMRGNTEKKLKELQCGECHQCDPEPETNCQEKCSGVKPINGTYNILFATESHSPDPASVISEEMDLSNSRTNTNLEEKLAQELEARKALNSKLFGNQDEVSETEKKGMNTNFQQDMNKQLEQEMTNALLAAKQDMNSEGESLLENQSKGAITSLSNQLNSSEIMSYDSGDNYPLMKVNYKNPDKSYIQNLKNRENKVKDEANNILGYDLDLDDVGSILIDGSKGSQYTNPGSNLPYSQFIKGNTDALSFDQQYNNIADLNGGFENPTVNSTTSQEVNSNSNIDNGSYGSSSTSRTRRNTGGDVHHHYYKSKDEPKTYYKKGKDSKLIPLITQDNIDGVSNVFAPYIHLEIPPNFVPTQDI